MRPTGQAHGGLAGHGAWAGQTCARLRTLQTGFVNRAPRVQAPARCGCASLKRLAAAKAPCSLCTMHSQRLAAVFLACALAGGCSGPRVPISAGYWHTVSVKNPETGPPRVSESDFCMPTHVALDASNIAAAVAGDNVATQCSTVRFTGTDQGAVFDVACRGTGGKQWRVDAMIDQITPDEVFIHGYVRRLTGFSAQSASALSAVVTKSASHCPTAFTP